MKKLPPWVLIVLAISTTVLFVLFILNKKNISVQRSEISSLEEKIEELEQKVSDLEKEKRELEGKVAEQIQLSGPITSDGITLQNGLNHNSRSNASGRGLAIVVLKPSSCDYFILENSLGYIIAEWMGGNDPEVGDKIVGDLNSFGTKDFYNQSRDGDCRLLIENYMLSKDSALEEINEKCN